MPDIGDLLSTAAPEVRSEPDLGRLERGAVRLARRRQALRAVPALALVLAVSALALLRAPGAPDELQEADGRIVSSTPGPALPTVGPGSTGAFAGANGTSVGPGTPGSAEPLPASSPSSARSVTQRPAPTATAYPPRPSCRVVSLGMAAGQTRSCSFTATEDGGYRVRAAHPGNDVAGDHWVDVTRNGKTTRYGDGSALSGNCGKDVIEPGDLVTVSIFRSEGNVFEFEMAAGEGYSCTTDG